MSRSATEIINRLQQLSGEEFEHFIADLWEKRGWDTSVTQFSGDRGVDVIAEQDDLFKERMVIQTKRYQPGNTVGGRQIRQYSATRNQMENVDKVVVITTSSFTESAIEEAKDQNVKLIDGQKLSSIIASEESNILGQYTTESATKDVSSKDIVKNTAPETSERSVDSRPSDFSDTLRVDLTGLKWVDTELQKQGRFLSSRRTQDFTGYIATFEMFGKDSSFGPEIEERDEVKFHTTSEETFSPGILSGKVIPDGWKSHTGVGDTVYIPPNEMVQYVVAVAAPKAASFEKITIKRWGVEIGINQRHESFLLNLPNAIESIL